MNYIIERRKKAEKILKDADLFMQPIKIVELARKNGFMVFEKDVDFDGAIIINNKEPFSIGNYKNIDRAIIVKRQNESRRRFTIAHELSHYFLEEDDNKEKLYAFRDNSIRNPKETEVNEFASELLIPHALLKKLVDAGSDGYPLIFEIAEAFNVSHECASIRLKRYISEKGMEINNG